MNGVCRTFAVWHALFFILASKNANDIEKMCIIYNMHDLFFFYGINL